MKKTLVFTAGPVLVAASAAQAALVPGGPGPLPFGDPGWYEKNPGDGLILVEGGPNTLTVVGDDSGLSSSFTGLNHSLDCGNIPGLDCVLNFTLDFYVSSDVNNDDFPVIKFSIQGITLIFGLADENGDLISNLNEQEGPISYSFNLGPSEALVGYEFGLGVFSYSGTGNPGIAKFSDVSIKKVPLPGTFAVLGAAGLFGGTRRRRA
jgi:hypothetical protein